MEGVRGIRNRIAHHESIIYRGLAVDYARMLKPVAWRCFITAILLNDIEGVKGLAQRL